MDKGSLVPDELVLKMIDARLDQPDAKPGIYPRRVSAQRSASGSAGWDAQTARRDDIEGSRHRCSRRGVGEAHFGAAHLPQLQRDVPCRPSIRRPSRAICNKCGGELYQREDDHEDTVRIACRCTTTPPSHCLTTTARPGLLSQVDGTGRPEEILNRIMAKLGGGARRLDSMITLKTPDELAIMRKASTIVAEILEELAAAVRPGVTTFELDKMAEELTYKKGAKPAFKGYQPGDVPYPQDVVRLGQRGNRARDPLQPQAEAGRYRRIGLWRGL